MAGLVLQTIEHSLSGAASLTQVEPFVSFPNIGFGLNTGQGTYMQYMIK